jgi:hypothetical protein
MGHQIILQPDGRLCAFSSIVDQIVLADATPQELEDYYAELAADESRRQTRRIIDAVLAEEPRRVYGQFVMTYAEAVEEHRSRGGEPELAKSN